MAKLTRRPKVENASMPMEKSDQQVERLADAFINKGGKSIVQRTTPQTIHGRVSGKSDPEAKIGITVKLFVKERDEINQLRKHRPIRAQVSLHDWIIEAVQEKLKKETGKYNI